MRKKNVRNTYMAVAATIKISINEKLTPRPFLSKIRKVCTKCGPIPAHSSIGSIYCRQKKNVSLFRSRDGPKNEGLF